MIEQPIPLLPSSIPYINDHLVIFIGPKVLIGKKGAGVKSHLLAGVEVGATVLLLVDAVALDDGGFAYSFFAKDYYFGVGGEDYLTRTSVRFVLAAH